MITEAQQYRIHMGDEKTFGEVFRENSMRVYHRALAILSDKLAARAVVIEAFTAFRTALRDAKGPVDADALLYRLTEEAIDRVDELRKRPPEEARQAEEALIRQDVERLPGRETFELPDEQPPEPAFEPVADEVRYDGRKYKSKAAGYVFSILVAILFAAVFFWLLFGALMRGGAMAYRDWGYTWFNEHILSWFNIRI